MTCGGAVAGWNVDRECPSPYQSGGGRCAIRRLCHVGCDHVDAAPWLKEIAGCRPKPSHPNKLPQWHPRSLKLRRRRGLSTTSAAVAAKAGLEAEVRLAGDSVRVAYLRSLDGSAADGRLREKAKIGAEGPSLVSL